ncbi:hypothetical protein [Ruania zhangjianzhongii]|uniref:hypothetical protein n=1 Tax=Ruania zhangjianzhongii TaxID=2603206 RepID=UPI0011C89315|nr:hypothetical protein [Ruania zhangjianzhongii]
MRSRRYLALAATAAAAALLVTGCQSGDDEPTVITEATYWRYQAVEDFDTSEHTVTDADQLAELAAILDSHEISGDVQSGEMCPGGITVNVEYTTDAGQHMLQVEGCERDEVGSEIAGLVTEWANP